MVRVDFHTHSVLSPDGSITAHEYRQALDDGVLDCVAITDHNEIAFAQELQRELGSDKIIVGEEIMTMSGEIIGLFLHEKIRPGATVEETVQHIKQQGGLVYIPHPLETARKGLSLDTMLRIVHDIDIIETANGRAFLQNKGPETLRWARQQHLPMAAASDAHRATTLGKTYTLLDDIPSTSNLVSLLMTAKKQYRRPNARDILAPKRSKLLKKLGKL
jgi:predicted metal-dependent phosphoesterase TrpH